MHFNLDRDVSIVDQNCVTKPFPKLPLSGYSRMPEVGHRPGDGTAQVDRHYVRSPMNQSLYWNGIRVLKIAHMGFVWFDWWLWTTIIFYLF